MARLGRIRIECPSCEKRYTVPAKSGGQSFACECGREFVAEDPASAGRVAGRIIDRAVGFLVFGAAAAALMAWSAWTHRYWADHSNTSRWIAVGVTFAVGGLVGEQFVGERFERLIGRWWFRDHSRK